MIQISVHTHAEINCWLWNHHKFAKSRAKQQLAQSEEILSSSFNKVILAEIKINSWAPSYIPSILSHLSYLNKNREGEWEMKNVLQLSGFAKPAQN